MKREKKNRFLADKIRRVETENEREKYESFLAYIANLKFPDPWPAVTVDLNGRSAEEVAFFLAVGVPAESNSKQPKENQDLWASFYTELRTALGKTWPEIWMADPDPPAHIAVRKMQAYLHRCWRASNDRERLWHIHRAREYYQRTRIFQETRELRIVMDREGDVGKFRTLLQELERRREKVLDAVPRSTFLEDALFHLQKMSQIKSRRPRTCETDDCATPYFFSHVKGTRYCANCRFLEQQQKTRKKASARETWKNNKAKYRPKGGSK